MRNFRECAAVTGRPIIALFIAALGVATVVPAQGRPLVPAEKRYDSYSGVLPNCGDPGVLERIRSRFHAREAEFWKSGLEIGAIDAVREIGMRSNGLDYIPRRYCKARAYFNDRSARTVSYNIVEGQGIIGFGYDVEWCVAGLDRNYTNALNCQLVRPIQ